VSDPDLARLVAAWPTLDDVIRAAINTMVLVAEKRAD
jgi:hypothetical protein